MSSRVRDFGQGQGIATFAEARHPLPESSNPAMHAIALAATACRITGMPTAHLVPGGGAQVVLLLDPANFMPPVPSVTTLPDLIEAAAAWRSFVWSRTDVSRPELLQLASEALPGEPSREEGLGAFGTLLNDGRLARVGSGRFRVSEDSRFNPGKLAG